MSHYYEDRYSRSYAPYRTGRFDRRDDRDWRDERRVEERRSYGGTYRPYASSSHAHLDRDYDRRSSAIRAAPASSSSSSYARSGREDDRYDHSHRRRETQTGKEKAERDDRGIKNKDMGYAFTGKEGHKYLERQLRNQLSSLNDTEAHTRGDSTPIHELTPRHIVEEFKRSGHFDAVRKQLFSAFQGSDHKNAFVDDLNAYLMAKLEDMPPRRRQYLAMQDQHLKTSELNTWLEEGKGSAQAFDRLFANLRGDSEKGLQEGRRGIFDQDDGKLGREIASRLQDVITSERQRANNARAGTESDDEDSSTPAIKSSVTPLGRETPSNSVGSRTPMPAMHQPYKAKEETT